jgi:hypothetical protein
MRHPFLLASVALLHAMATRLDTVQFNPRLLKQTGDRRYMYEHTHGDIFGGKNHYSFDARHSELVFSLDANPLITAVDCNGTDMRVGTNDVRAFQMLIKEGNILSGRSPAWNCKDNDGNVLPFNRLIHEIKYFLLDGDRQPVPYLDYGMSEYRTPVAGSVLLRAEDAPLERCFERLSLHYYREPGPVEEDLRRELRNNLTLQRELGITSDFLTNMKKQPADNTGGGGNIAYMYQRSLLNWNFDIETGKAVPNRKDLISTFVYCKDCYFYIGASLNFKIDISNFQLASLEMYAMVIIILSWLL